MIQPYLADVDTLGETALVYIDGRFSHALKKGPLLVAGSGLVDGRTAPRAAHSATLSEPLRIRALGISDLRAVAGRTRESHAPALMAQPVLGHQGHALVSGVLRAPLHHRGMRTGRLL